MILYLTALYEHFIFKYIWNRSVSVWITGIYSDWHISLTEEENKKKNVKNELYLPILLAIDNDTVCVEQTGNTNFIRSTFSCFLKSDYNLRLYTFTKFKRVFVGNKMRLYVVIKVVYVWVVLWQFICITILVVS